MNSTKHRKEFAYVDHSAVYFENERLADKMRQQVDSLSKDKLRAFLNRQAEIASVMENLDKLQAFRQAVSNTATFRLTTSLNNSCSVPNHNRSNENLVHQETNKKYPCSKSSPLGSKGGRNSGEVPQPFDKSTSTPVISEKISCIVQNDSINRTLSNQNRNRYVRTSWGMDGPRDHINRMSPFVNSRPNSVRDRHHRSLISGTSGLERQKLAPLFKTSSQFSSHMQGARVLNKRPSSCKEQWTGLTEGLTQKRNSSAPLFKTSSHSSHMQGARVLNKRPSSCKEQWTGFTEGLTQKRNSSAPLFKTSSQFSSHMQGARVLNKRPSSCKEQWTGLTEGLTQKRNSSAPLFKTSSQFSSHMQGARVLNKRPSSCKEQWTGLTEGLTQKRNSSAAADWPRFRSAQTRRICTVGCPPRYIEALTLRRLREIYILDKPEVGMSGHRRANFIQHLLLLNQKRNKTLQEKVRNFLEELTEKRRKMSVCTKLSTSMSNRR